MAQASDDPIPTVTAYQPVPLTMRAALRRTYGGPDQVTIETLSLIHISEPTRPY